MLSLLDGISRAWTEDTILGLDALRRGLTDPFPVEEDPPPVTPYEVIHESGRIRLRYYRGDDGSRRTPLLLVYSLIKRPFILDLDTRRSVVRNLLRRGFDVYLTDWLPPEDCDSWRGLDAYVNGDLDGAVRAIRRHRGVKQVSMLGYCFGGLLSAVYAALHPEPVEKLITLAIPFDLSLRETPLSGLIDRLDPGTLDLVTEIHGNCPAWLVRASFQSMAPVYQLLDKHVRRARTEEDPAYAETFARFERWMESDVPLAGQILREMTRLVRRNGLVEGGLEVGGRAVRFGEISCPVLNIVGENDDVVVPASSLPFTRHVGSRDSRDLLAPGGHMALAVSGAAHRDLWPKVGAWLERTQHPR